MTGKYVGAEKCNLCHTRIHQKWSATLHAEALEALEGVGQGTNASCLGCHTVAFGQAGGFVDRATTNGLAGVQCEGCHGPGLDHMSNVGDESLRPPIPLDGVVCGQCHTGSHNPIFDEWSESAHAELDEHVAVYFADGQMLTSCGPCHSGDYRSRAIIGDEGSVGDDALAGTDPDEMNGVTCCICHNPHSKTGNSADPEHDRQLRYPQIVLPTPSNLLADAQDPSRFNLCGQCHHSRGRTWDATSRGPHHSIQSNVYFGEMPMPAGQEGTPLVANEGSLHTFVSEQCTTCHMYSKDFVSEQEPAITGHSFHVNTSACTGTGCHPSPADAVARMAITQGSTTARLAAIAARLGDVSTWEYTSDGGPDAAGQAALSDEIKKIRFLYHYVDSDGSGGVHNPQYVDAMLDEAEVLLTSISK